MKSKSKSRSKKSVWPRRTIAILLVVIVVLGFVALYYSPVLNGLGPRTLTPDQIYALSSQSVVTIQGVTKDLTLDTYPNGTLNPVLGTGFVITYDGSYYIVTNYHVIDGLLDSTVTFSNGDSYPA